MALPTLSSISRHSAVRVQRAPQAFQGFVDLLEERLVPGILGAPWVVLLPLLSLLVVSCTSYWHSQTTGTSGPVRWQVMEATSTSNRVEERYTYAFTLVLQEVEGKALTFTTAHYTRYSGTATVSKRDEWSQEGRWTLRPYGTWRVPFSYTVTCPEGSGCIKLDWLAPAYHIVLTGTDDHNAPVHVVIDLKLPPDPTVLQPPPAGVARALPASSVKAEDQSPAALRPFEAAAPQWHLGDEWRFRWESPRGKGTFTWIITREEMVDAVAYYVGASGTHREIYWRQADLAHYTDNVDGEVEMRHMPPREEYLWPLVPGKRWEQTYTEERPRDRQTQDIARVCEVVAAETITVPAGSFSTLKIRCHNQRTGALMAEMWYAPEAKQWIRERWHFTYGIRERELLAFKVH